MAFYLSTTIVKFLALLRLRWERSGQMGPVVGAVVKRRRPNHVACRKTMAEVPRPYRIALSTPALALFVLPPSLLCAVALLYMRPGTWLTLLLTIAAAAVSYPIVSSGVTPRGIRRDTPIAKFEPERALADLSAPGPLAEAKEAVSAGTDGRKKYPGKAVDT